MKKCMLAPLFLVALSFVWASDCCNAEKEQKTNPSPVKTNASEDAAKLDAILSEMKAATEQLKSCEANLNYLFIQDPELLDSRTLKNGVLYYSKDKDRSRLRIRFDDSQQDNFEPVKQRLEYLFDGVWLTRIDYKVKQVDEYQKAPEDSPIDVFELISHNFPLIGFSGVDDLKKDFEVSLVPQKPEDPNTSTQLLLKTQKGSKLNDEYEKIDFWVNNETFLPLRVRAYATQGDIYDICFIDAKINKKLKNSVFTIETPAGFSKNREALKTESKPKGN